MENYKVSGLSFDYSLGDCKHPRDEVFPLLFAQHAGPELSLLGTQDYNEIQTPVTRRKLLSATVTSGKQSVL